MAAANQYADVTSVKARQELDAMRALKSIPMTARELSEVLGITQNRAKHIISGLQSAECIVRVPGSHSVMLRGV